MESPSPTPRALLRTISPQLSAPPDIQLSHCHSPLTGPPNPALVLRLCADQKHLGILFKTKMPQVVIQWGWNGL